MTPTVSVIIPAFNTRDLVGRAIDSALHQTFTDCEVLVIDDGSTDGTAQVVEDIARRDSRVRLWSQPNRGLARSRNRALAEARGRFFALLDSDDEWVPWFLETLLGILERNPDVSIVTANAINRGGPDDGQPYWPVTAGLERLTLLDLIEREDSVCIMSMFRREVYAAIGGYDDTFIRASEDYDFWLRAAHAGFLIARTRQPLAFYQRRDESLSANPVNMLEGVTRALDRLRATRSLSVQQLAALERQLARFAQMRLSLEATHALRQHDFRTAADRFGALRAKRGGARLAVLAAWSRIAPASLLRVDTLRRSMRGHAR